jgi:hypothetical protein
VRVPGVIVESCCVNIVGIPETAREAVTIRAGDEAVRSGEVKDGSAESLSIVISEDKTKVRVVNTFLLQSGIGSNDIGISADVVSRGADFVIRGSLSDT